MSDKKSIMIVDDSQAALLSLCTLIMRMGFGIIPTENGSEALRPLNFKTPSLALIDVNTTTDGIKTLKNIKDTTPNIPVVMLLGINDSAAVAQYKELGCSDYLPKPFDVRELQYMLQKWIYQPVGGKRMHLRVDIAKPVYVLYNEMLYALMSETLSEGGIYVKKEVPLPVGSWVRVTLEARDEKVLILNGRVIYKCGSNNYDSDISPGMAIEFMDMKDGEAAELSQYVVGLVNESLTFN